MKPIIWNNVCEFEGHIKWNKQHTERQVAHDKTYKWNQNYLNLSRTKPENRTVVFGIALEKKYWKYFG